MTKLTFKKIDFWLQITLILIFFSSALIFFTSPSFYLYKSTLTEVSFISFFLIAIWQVLSAIINFFWIKINSKSRHLWEAISALMLILPFSVLLGYSYSINSSFFALFFAPFLAIWYLVITWQELKEIEKIATGK